MVPFVSMEALSHGLTHKEYIQNFPYERPSPSTYLEREGRESLWVENMIKEKELALFREWYEVPQDVHLWVPTINE